MNTWIFILLILIVTIIFIFLTNKKQIEHFGINYSIDWENSYQDYRFQKYAQNHNKNWIQLPNAYNSPIVSTYGTSYIDLYKQNQYIFNDFEKKDLEKFVRKYTQKVDFDEKDYLITYTPFDIYNLNKNTWYNRYDWNPDYTLYQKYISSMFSEINVMNKIFLYSFNQYFYNFTAKYVKRKIIQYKPFFIMKHRIVNVFSSKKKIDGNPESRIFDIVTVVARDNSFLAFEFQLIGKFLLRGKEYLLDRLEIKYTSNYSLDEVLLRKSLEKNNTYFNLNPLWKNQDEITSAEAKKIYEKGKEEVLESRDFLEYQYVCHSYNKRSKDPLSIPIFATDRNDCENQYDIMGYKKPAGVWDRPCLDDEDCIFYKKNKNYDNSFGRCIQGTCQLPLNMRNLGYHYYINEPNLKPLCYNCKSKEWLPNTKMDFCCDEQKDRKKYPFLKGPDYAFKGDNLARFNEYRQKKCKIKPNYDNIFKKTNVWKIECDGFLDSYMVKN